MASLKELRERVKNLQEVVDAHENLMMELTSLLGLDDLADEEEVLTAIRDLVSNDED